LLASLGVAFEIIPAEVTEHEAHDADPREMVRHNAALKADWVAARHPAATVIGADTTVFIDRTVLNKPRDLNAARAMLKLLAGRTHTVFTGLAVRRQRDGLKLDQGVASEVTFKAFDDAALELYLSRVHTLDKAGGYAIQEQGDLIIAGFTGSLTNIVGLPLEEMKQLLTRAGLTR
jgi:septum formation protein